MHLTDVLPDEVKSNVPRFRAAKMLHTALGRPTGSGPTSGVCATAAAVWLENKVYRAVCAVAIETSNQANSQHAAQSSSTVHSKGSGGDTTVTTQGAGSAFNKYLANITRLTFALQVRSHELHSAHLLCHLQPSPSLSHSTVLHPLQLTLLCHSFQFFSLLTFPFLSLFLLKMSDLWPLRDKLLTWCMLCEEDLAPFNSIVDATVLAKSTTELEEITARIFS